MFLNLSFLRRPQNLVHSFKVWTLLGRLRQILAAFSDYISFKECWSQNLGKKMPSKSEFCKTELLFGLYGILWFQRNLVWLRFWVNYRTKHSHYTRYYCHWNLRLKSYWTRSASLRPMEVYPNRARPARIRSRKRRPMIVWQGTYFFTFLSSNWLRAIIFCNRKRKLLYVV